MCPSVSVGSMGYWGGVCMSSVHVSICDTFNAAGPHSPSGMWDFQVENRACRGRNNSSRRGAVGKKKGRGAEDDVYDLSKPGRIFIFK